MAQNRQQQRLRLARMEAKRELRLAQVQRRRRDNMLASLSALVVVVLAVVLQLTTFVNNPTVAEMAAIEESMEVPSSSRAPTPGTSATATPSSSSPSSARSTSAAQSPTAASAGKTNSGPVPPASLAAGQSFTGIIATNFGAIDVKLNGDKAPQTVSVFKTLAEKNYFKGKSCHPLTTGKQLKVLQCGSKNGDGSSDPQYQWGPVENAPADGK